MNDTRTSSSSLSYKRIDWPTIIITIGVYGEGQNSSLQRLNCKYLSKEISSWDRYDLWLLSSIMNKVVLKYWPPSDDARSPTCLTVFSLFRFLKMILTIVDCRIPALLSWHGRGAIQEPRMESLSRTNPRIGPSLGHDGIEKMHYQTAETHNECVHGR